MVRLRTSQFHVHLANSNARARATAANRFDAAIYLRLAAPAALPAIVGMVNP